MKKLFYILLGILLMLGVSSCVGGIGGDDEGFDVTKLYGRWQEGSVYERYDSTGWGATWDMNDVDDEEDAQLFKWSLEGSTLVHEHVGVFVTVPKIYTVTTLNEAELAYEDDYGTSRHFSKVER